MGRKEVYSCGDVKQLMLVLLFIVYRVFHVKTVNLLLPTLSIKARSAQQEDKRQQRGAEGEK